MIVNLQCNKCGWLLWAQTVNVEGQERERQACKLALIKAADMGWRVGKHSSDEDLCPGCAVV